MTKTLYITGGTGFIGAAVADRFANSGWFVFIQTRSSHKYIDQKLIKYVAQPEEIDRKIDILINLAGKPLATRWTKDSKQEIYRSRVDFTLQLAKEFSSIPDWAPSAVLSTSAIGYYATGDNPHTETSENGTGFSAKLCRDWELAARSFEDLGCSVSILRLGVVLDKTGGSLKAMLPSFRLGLGARLGTGQQWFSWIGLTDLLNIYEYCAAIIEGDGLPKVINASAPKPVTNIEFTRQLALALGRPAFMQAPKFALKAILGEGAEDFLLANLRVLPDYLLDQEFEFADSEIDQLFKRIL